MIYVEDINYKNIHENQYKQQRLPILQSGNLESLMAILQTKYDSMQILELKNFVNDIRSKHVISVNCNQYVSEDCSDIFVKFYQNTAELVKIKLVNMIRRYKSLPSNTIYSIIKHDYFINNLFDENVKEDIVRSISNSIGNMGSCDCGNLLEALDWIELDDNLKEVSLRMIVELNNINEYAFDMMCNFDELKEFIKQSPLYFSFFIKEIQFQLHTTELDTCVGVADVEYSVLPVFDIAGVCDNIFKASKYVLVPEYKSILTDMLSYKIENETDFRGALSASIRINCIDKHNEAFPVIMHELSSVLCNSKIAFKNDLYSIVIRKAIEN